MVNSLYHPQLHGKIRAGGCKEMGASLSTLRCFHPRLQWIGPAHSIILKKKSKIFISPLFTARCKKKKLKNYTFSFCIKKLLPDNHTAFAHVNDHVTSRNMKNAAVPDNAISRLW